MSITATELKANLSKYLLMAATEDIFITRNGKIIAKLTSPYQNLNAICSEVSDFEDNVMIETAVRSNMDCIITRNTKDYIKSPIPVYTPTQFVEIYERK